jgi:hypothetical protein
MARFNFEELAEKYFDPTGMKDGRGNQQHVYGFSCEENLDGSDATRRKFSGASVPRLNDGTDDPFVHNYFLAMSDLAMELDLEYANENSWYVVTFQNVCIYIFNSLTL